MASQNALKHGERTAQAQTEAKEVECDRKSSPGVTQAA